MQQRPSPHPPAPRDAAAGEGAAEPGPGVAFAHLGLPKAGSTFLQLVFAREAARLAAAGIHYIPYPAFRAGFSRHALGWRRPGAPAAKDMAAAVARLLPAARPGAVLISDETLLGHLHTGQGPMPDQLFARCGRRVALLKRAFGRERLTVFLCIRRFDEFLEAAYLQRIRLGARLSFAEYVGRLDLDRLSWVPMVTEIAAALSGPHDRLVVLDHARLREAPAATLAGLFAAMGAAPPAAVPNRRVNQSFSPRQYRAFRAFNRAWPAARLPRLRRLAAGILERATGRRGGRAGFLDAGRRTAAAARHADLAAIAALGGKVTVAESAAPAPAPQART